MNDEEDLQTVAVRGIDRLRICMGTVRAIRGCAANEAIETALA